MCLSLQNDADQGEGVGEQLPDATGAVTNGAMLNGVDNNEAFQVLLSKRHKKVSGLSLCVGCVLSLLLHSCTLQSRTRTSQRQRKQRTNKYVYIQI